MAARAPTAPQELMLTRRLTIVAAVAFSVAGSLATRAPLPVAAGPAIDFSLRLSLTTQCTHPARDEFPQPYGSVAVGDLHGDGHQEVVAALPDGSVRVSDAGGNLQWITSTGDANVSSPTLADLDGNGRLSVIVSSYDGFVHIWDDRGTPRAGWPQGTIGQPPTEKGFFSSVAVGDAFADGRKELFASGLDQHTYAWYPDGTPLAGWPKVVFDSALATPTLYDLEHRHKLDIVTPSDSSGGAPGPNGPYQRGAIYWTWRPEGTQVGAFANINPDQVPWSSPAVDDLGGQGQHVLVNGTGDNFANPSGHQILGFRTDGNNQPGFPIGTTGKVFASPAVGDIGVGGRVSVDVDENGVVYANNGSGGAAGPGWPKQLPTAANGFGYADPNFNAFHGGPALAPVDGSGHNGVILADGIHLLGLNNVGGTVFDVQTPDGGFIYDTPTVADIGAGHLTAFVISESGPASCGGTNTFDVTGFALNATSLGAAAWPTFHGNMQRTGSNLGLDAPPPIPPHGYWMVASDGGIFPFGNAFGYGSTGGIHLNQPIVAMGSLRSDSGYFLVASDGGIFPFGTARGYGSLGNVHLNQPIVGMAVAPHDDGYWLVASDGGIFPFGNALGLGSTGNVHLNQPIVGMATTPDGGGYWLVARDGGIFPFGDAFGYGSTGGIHLNQPIVGMAATPSGHGYWLVASDGGIFPFGDAFGYGSTGGIHLNQPIIGMTSTNDGQGYWLAASDGGIFPFGDAGGYGSTGGQHLNQPIVGISRTAITTK